MFIGGGSLAIFVLWVYSVNGIFTNQINVYLPSPRLSALATIIVESPPIKEMDNITVTFKVVISGHFLLYTSLLI